MSIQQLNSKVSVLIHGFFPLPFGRTNVLSQDVVDFFSLIGRQFPPVFVVSGMIPSALLSDG
jgi:hypothetical protein